MRDKASSGRYDYTNEAKDSKKCPRCSSHWTKDTKFISYPDGKVCPQCHDNEKFELGKKYPNKLGD